LVRAGFGVGVVVDDGEEDSAGVGDALDFDLREGRSDAVGEGDASCNGFTGPVGFSGGAGFAAGVGLGDGDGAPKTAAAPRQSSSAIVKRGNLMGTAAARQP